MPETNFLKLDALLRLMTYREVMDVAEHFQNVTKERDCYEGGRSIKWAVPRVSETADDLLQAAANLARPENDVREVEDDFAEATDA